VPESESNACWLGARMISSFAADDLSSTLPSTRK
jgi:hypothetical protein